MIASPSRPAKSDYTIRTWPETTQAVQDWLSDLKLQLGRGLRGSATQDLVIRAAVNLARKHQQEMTEEFNRLVHEKAENVKKGRKT